MFNNCRFHGFPSNITRFLSPLTTFCKVFKFCRIGFYLFRGLAKPANRISYKSLQYVSMLGLSRRRALASGLGLIGVSSYAYDTLEGGAKINRSGRAAYVALATFVEYKFILGNTDYSLNEIHKRVAERWLWCVRQNGGLYSKLAQAVASMNHVLPPEYLETLSVIQDKAPTVRPSEVEKVLRQEFGKSSAELFATFEPEAVASASVAQVHRATLKDGTKLAVKIQKPAIAKQIDADLFMYRLLAYFLEKAFSLPIMWSIPYTCGQLRQETDFRIEAENGRLALENTEPDLKNSITIPKIYPELSSKRVLTCEWIDGVKISDGKAIRALGLDPVEVMTIVTRFFSHQLFVSGHLQYVCTEFSTSQLN